MSSSLTFQDIVSHVMDAADVSETVVDLRRAIRAARWGFAQATQRHDWGSYDTEFTAVFNAEYDTGTIDIDADGVVTLTDGTWPSWAALASLYITDERAYRVATRDSDTALTLESWTGETETALAYNLRQDRVLIPDDVRYVFDVWQEREDWSLRIVDVKTFRDYDRPRIYSGADPVVVTFRAVNNLGVNQTEMRISPAATTLTEVSVAYMRRARVPNILVQTTGTSGSGDLVYLDTELPLGPSVVDCLLRTSDNEEHATADTTFSIKNVNAAVFEGLITVHTDQTTITVPDAPSLDGDPVVITSVLDIPGYLLNAVQMYAEAQMLRIGNRNYRDAILLTKEADEELRYAMEQDAPFVRRHGSPLLRIDQLQSMQSLYVVES
jgi:hypothetical protein